MQIITSDDNPWPAACKSWTIHTTTECNCCIKALETFHVNKLFTLDFFAKMSGFMFTIALEHEEFPRKLSQLMLDIKLADSISDAMRKIKAGGVKVNHVKINDTNHIPKIEDLFNQNWLLIQFGKSNAGIVHVRSKDCD